MKPPPFRYMRATTLNQAIEVLSPYAGRAKVLAGGQSLMPMLNFRLLEPEVLVDINGIEALKGIAETATGLRIGALTRHREVATSPLVARHFPVVTAAMRQVAHMSIRNRGTFGGSVSHADPAAEMPLMCMLLDARMVIAGPRGERTLPACDFFLGALTTALADDEILTSVDLPLPLQPSVWGFEEMAVRAGDYALASVGVVLTMTASGVAHPRIALGGVGQTPLRASAAEAVLKGNPLTDEVIAAAANAAARDCDPMSDLHASAEYRRHLVDVLVRRCLRTTRARAAGKAA